MPVANRGWWADHRPPAQPVHQLRQRVVVAVGDQQRMQQALVHPARRSDDRVVGEPDNAATPAEPAQQIHLIAAEVEVLVVAGKARAPERHIGRSQVGNPTSPSSRRGNATEP